MIQKPISQAEHSRLQYKLCAALNEVTEPEKIAIAFPELRCIFGGKAISFNQRIFLRGDRISSLFNKINDFISRKDFDVFR